MTSKKAKPKKAAEPKVRAGAKTKKEEIERRLKEIEKRTGEVDMELGRIEAELEGSMTGPSKVIEEDFRKRERITPPVEDTSCEEDVEEPKRRSGLRESYRKFVYRLKKTLK